MNLKTYQARTMSDALAEVKRDLGRDAVILHTRNFRRGGFLGLGGKRFWEITAAPNVNVPARLSGGRAEGRYVPVAEPAGPDGMTDDDVVEIVEEKEVIESAQAVEATLPEEPALGEAKNGFVAQQMADIRRMVESLLARQGSSPRADVPAELAPFQAQLLAQDVGEEIVDDIIGQLKLTLTGEQLADKSLIQAKLCEMIESLIPAAPPIDKATGRVIALIGPTGVGKTTTIAKLSANFKLREHKKVGLITIDTYRIAAVDQLRTYAEIIDIPLQTVLTAGELAQTVKSMRHLDVILIDTAGRSQNDRLRLNQLRGFLEAAQADEVHLVVSATANRKCAVNTLEKFIPLGANRIIMTKLDEAATFGSILNVSAAGKIALSYVTAGQDVPEDIVTADPHRIASWIVGGGMGEGIYAS